MNKCSWQDYKHKLHIESIKRLIIAKKDLQQQMDKTKNHMILRNYSIQFDKVIYKIIHIYV